MTERSDLDELVTIPVRATFRQLREINRRAGLRVFDGAARGEFILGCALDEPRVPLLDRVHAVRDRDRERFRAELEAARTERARKHGGSATAAPSGNA